MGWFFWSQNQAQIIKRAFLVEVLALWRVACVRHHLCRCYPPFIVFSWENSSYSQLKKLYQLKKNWKENSRDQQFSSLHSPPTACITNQPALRRYQRTDPLSQSPKVILSALSTWGGANFTTLKRKLQGETLFALLTFCWVMLYFKLFWGKRGQGLALFCAHEHAYMP